MKCKVEYIDHMGDDLRVVNAARVSFDKESKLVRDTLKTVKYVHPHNGDDSEYEIYGEPYVSKSDKKLIKYLAKHNHWTPFSHCQATFRITAPIFLARQLFKHKIGFTENEVSRRYVDAEPEFYTPDYWRKKVENKKQGSSDEEVREPLVYGGNPHFHMSTDEVYKEFITSALKLYNQLLGNETCPEQARMVLPQSMMTSWYWTGSLSSWARLHNLRASEDAQREHLEITEPLNTKMVELFPLSWVALTGKKEFTT